MDTEGHLRRMDAVTKRDYDLIAACIATQRRIERDCNNSEVALDVLHDFSRALGVELLNTNPRFDLTRFLKACGTYVEWEVD